MHTHACTHVSQILDPFALKCRARARTANAPRAYERMLAIMSAPISRGRSFRFSEFALQNYDGTNSRALVSAAKTLVPPDRNYERSLKRCWWYGIINIAAMLTRGEIVGIRRE